MENTADPEPLKFVDPDTLSDPVSATLDPSNWKFCSPLNGVPVPVAVTK